MSTTADREITEPLKPVLLPHGWIGGHQNLKLLHAGHVDPAFLHSHKQVIEYRLR